MKSFSYCSIVAALLITCSNALDSEKDNGTAVHFSHDDDNAYFGDDHFSDASHEQLPCADLKGYAFHNQSNKCWPIGSRGPCPELMKFFSDPEHEGYGDCDCIPMRNCIGRPRTYWQETDRCYFIFSKGPCKAGEWLVFNKNQQPECQPNNVCEKQIKNGRALDFLFSHNGKCHKTGSQAFCGENEKVYISSSDLKPRCFAVKPVCRFLIFTAKTLSCRLGSKFEVSGRCEHMRELADDIED